MTTENNSLNYLHCPSNELFADPDDSQQVKELSLLKIAMYSDIINSKPYSGCQTGKFYRVLAKNTAIEYYRKCQKNL